MTNKRYENTSSPSIARMLQCTLLFTDNCSKRFPQNLRNDILSKKFFLWRNVCNDVRNLYFLYCDSILQHRYVCHAGQERQDPSLRHYLRIHVFTRKVFSLSTETFLTFSRFHYQHFLKTFSAKIFEFQIILRMHINGKWKSSMCTWNDNRSFYVPPRAYAESRKSHGSTAVSRRKAS